MDPGFISRLDWSDIGSALTFLWFIPLCIAAAAFTILLAHGIIPSLIATGELPKKFQKRRRGLYVLAAMLVGAGLFFFVTVVTRVDLVDRFWTRWWI